MIQRNDQAPDQSSSQPPNSPPPPDDVSRWPLALKVGLGLGSLALGGGAATAIWGRAVVNQQVIPRLEAGLEETFERPVQVGQLEHFTLTGFRIGPSYLPPTAAVQTEATVEAIDVTISWRDLVFQRIVRPSLTLIDANVVVVQAADGRWVDLTLPEPDDEEEGFISFTLGELRVENAQVAVTSLVPRPDAIVVAETILIQAVNGEVYVTPLEEPDVDDVVFEVEGTLGEGRFQARGNGQLEQERLNVSVQTNNLPTVGINMFLPPKLGLRGGTLDSNFTAELRLQDEVQPVSARGTAQFQGGKVLLSQLPEPIHDLNTTLRLQGDRVLLEETGLSLGTIPLTAAGTVHFQTGYDLTTAIAAVSLAQVTALLDVDLPIQAAGSFQFEGTVSGPLDQPTLVGNIANLGPVQADQVTVESLSANFAASLDQFTLQALRVIPATGGFITGQGRVDLADLANPSFAADLQADLPGDAMATLYGVALPNQAVMGSVQAVGQIGGSLTNPEGVVQFQLPESTYPGGGQATLRDSTLVVDQTQFQVEGGTVNATALARLDLGDWSAEVTTANVPVERFTDQARGLLSAVVNASGNLQALNLAAIEASGTALIAEAEVALAPGAPSLLERGDWTTAFSWAGSGVEVERFDAPGVTAAGFIATNFANHGAATPPIDSVNLDVQLSAYDLARLAPLIPEPARAEVALAGLTNFAGQVTGPLANLRLQGNAQLDHLAVNALAFEPRLAGPVNVSLAEGGEVDLRGGRDRIAATLDRDLLPSQFALRRGDTTAEGQMVNRQLVATLQNFPIEALGLAPAADAGLGSLGGLLDTTLSADLSDWANPAAQGFATIANPALGNIVAESFAGQYSYGDGTVALADGDLRFVDSQYRLTGQAELASLAYSGQIDIVAGNFEDLLATLGWADFADIGFSPPAEANGTAADVATVPATLPAAPFLEQVQAFAEFLAAHEPRGNGTQVALPPLDALRGEFSGVITVQGEGFSAETVQATADVQGQDWRWGRLLPCDPMTTAESLDFSRPAIAPGACNQF